MVLIQRSLQLADIGNGRSDLNFSSILGHCELKFYFWFSKNVWSLYYCYWFNIAQPEPGYLRLSTLSPFLFSQEYAKPSQSVLWGQKAILGSLALDKKWSMSLRWWRLCIEDFRFQATKTIWARWSWKVSLLCGSRDVWRNQGCKTTGSQGDDRVRKLPQR